MCVAISRPPSNGLLRQDNASWGLYRFADYTSVVYFVLQEQAFFLKI